MTKDIKLPPLPRNHLSRSDLMKIGKGLQTTHDDIVNAPFPSNIQDALTRLGAVAGGAAPARKVGDSI